MAIRNAKQILAKNQQVVVPKGHIPIYVGDNKTRFIVPLSYLSHPLFQDLLQDAEDEFGFNHSMGGLTIPCSQETFFELASELDQC